MTDGSQTVSQRKPFCPQIVSFRCLSHNRKAANTKLEGKTSIHLQRQQGQKHIRSQSATSKPGTCRARHFKPWNKINTQQECYMQEICTVKVMVEQDLSRQAETKFLTTKPALQIVLRDITYTWDGRVSVTEHKKAWMSLEKWLNEGKLGRTPTCPTYQTSNPLILMEVKN